MHYLLTFFLAMSVLDPLEQARQAIVNENFSEARALLEPIAKEGNAQAQYLLGHLMDLGLGGPAQPDKALLWWLKAAEEDHPDALFRAGLAYLQGRGVDPDINRGLELLERSALFGHHGAEAAIGTALMNNARGSGHVPEALVWLSCAAEAGDRPSAEIVGAALAKGTEETLADVPKAVKFLRLAESLGSPHARQLLNELDPAKDAPIATAENVHLLWESARLGFPDAQFRLAVLGLANVPWGPSREQALALLEAAATNGHPEACYRWLQYLRKKGPVDAFVEGHLLRTAVTGGFTAATLELGQYLAKYGSPEALRWLRAAYQGGQSQAGLAIARLFLEGTILPRDEREARRVLAELKKSQDPNVRKEAARLLLASFDDPQACHDARELDSEAPCSLASPTTTPTPPASP